MLTRLIPSLVDRAALTSGTPDVNPFAGEGSPGDNLSIASFLRGDEFVRVEELLTVAAAPIRVEANVVAAASRPVAITPPVAPTLGVIAEVGTLPDRLISADGSTAFDNTVQLTPAPDRAASLPDHVARGAATSNDSAASPVAADAPSPSPVAILRGGPLIVQIDPTSTAATPVSDAVQSIPTTVVAPPVTASTPGFTLEWAPVLEAHGSTASAHVALFDTDSNIDDGLLTALYQLPPLPPITPPNGDGLGA